MRFEYDPPEPLLAVAYAGQFLMYDRELRAFTTLLISQTPLGIPLREQVRLSGDVTVTAVERSGGFLRVTMYRTNEPGEGRLTLVFNPEPMELRQWAVFDAQRRETSACSASGPGLRSHPALFQFNDPRFFEPGAWVRRRGMAMIIARREIDHKLRRILSFGCMVRTNAVAAFTKTPRNA